MKQTTRNYIFIGLVAGALGIGSGAFLGEYLGQPVKTYVRDVNYDKTKDIVIKRRDNETIIFIQLKDGKYISLDEYISSKKKEIKNKNSLEMKAIEKERRSLDVEGMLTR